MSNKIDPLEFCHANLVRELGFLHEVSGDDFARLHDTIFLLESAILKLQKVIDEKANEKYT